MMKDRFPEVEVLESNDNRGFARASNLCWRRAHKPLVLFLNSDTVVPQGALERMVALMNDRDDLGALGPLLKNADGSIQMSFGKMLSLSAELRQKFLNAGYRNGRGPLRGYVENLHARERTVDWVSGACLLTRRELLERVGGFDEEFFLYSEDVDLCARIRAEGSQSLVHARGRDHAPPGPLGRKELRQSVRRVPEVPPALLRQALRPTSTRAVEALHDNETIRGVSFPPVGARNVS